MTRALFTRKTIWNNLFYFCGLLASVLGLAVLLFFLSAILRNDWDRLSIDFLLKYPSRFPEKAGFLPNSLFSPFTAMPIQIFNWVSRPQNGQGYRGRFFVFLYLKKIVVVAVDRWATS